MIRNRKLVIRGIALCDQVFFSAANFLFTIILAKFYSEIELAGYGIGLSIAMTLQGIQRTSYMVQNSLLSPEVLRRRATKVMGQQVTVWCFLFAAELIVIGICTAVWGRSEFFLAIAYSTIVLTLVYIQLDFDRILMIKHERFIDPLVTSALFLALNAALFVCIPRYHISFEVMMAVLGLYAFLKSFWLVAIIGWPDLFWGWRLMMRDARRYFAASLVGVAGYFGYNNFPIMILGSVAAPIHSAAFAAMRSLMQPLLVIVRSLDIIDKNFFQSKSKSKDGMRSAFFRLVAMYGGMALVMVAAMALFNEPLVRLVYGEKYAAYSHLLFGWGWVFFMLTISSPIETVIVRTGKLNRYNLYRIPAGLFGVGLAILLCPTLGAWGAIIACLGGWIVSVAAALWLIRDVIFAKPTA
jgi:O-antigen/teichoic acid export membrane protein